MVFNLLPETLWMGPLLTPLILRVAVGVLLLILALKFYRHTATHTRISRTITGGLTLIGALLLLGLFTQYAALIGIAVALFLLFFGNRYGELHSESSLFYVLAITVLISLFLSGAGPLSIDAPL